MLLTKFVQNSNTRRGSSGLIFYFQIAPKSAYSETLQKSDANKMQKRCWHLNAQMLSWEVIEVS